MSAAIHRHSPVFLSGTHASGVLSRIRVTARRRRAYPCYFVILLRHGICLMTQMIYRTLGDTGERVSAIGVGGWHLALKHVDEKLAIRIVRESVDRGINFLDNCWDYNEGASE